MATMIQAKINERGIAALAYNVLLRPGVTLGLGASLDTQNLSEAGHKVCSLCPTDPQPSSNPSPHHFPSSPPLFPHLFGPSPIQCTCLL